MITVDLPLALRVAVIEASVAFLAVFVACWIRYGIRQLADRRGLRLGRDRRRRVPGEQPLCEFTGGPAGLFWHDQVLVEVIEAFERHE